MTCHTESTPACHAGKKKTDWLLLGSGALVALLFAWSYMPVSPVLYLSEAAAGVQELVLRMWWGVLIGMVMVGLLAKIPREFVMAILGRGGSFTGLVRAVCAGVLLDLCSHGILIVGAKLYERGASYGQVVAFLVASPWNSFSLTLVLVALVGLKMTVLFIVFSMIIALLSGLVFDALERRGVIGRNPNTPDKVQGFAFWAEARKGLKSTRFDRAFLMAVTRHAVLDSRMVLRWILFGIVLAVLVRTFVHADMFASYFGPSMMGLMLTIGVATVLEVCSEGSTPLAADLVTRANAPGNAFAFLMTGVATDYTEIMTLKETTGRWLNALLLPVVTVPQVLVIAVLLN